MLKKILTIFLIGFTTLGFAQDKAALERKKEQILKEIKSFRELLSKENTKEKSALTELSESDTKIKLSEKLINNTQKQTKILTDDIYLNQLEINKLNRELKVLKEDYAKTLVTAYKNRSQQSRIMFILSSDSFLQAYKRMQYMKQYASYRKIQGEEIKATKTELEELGAKLNAQKKEKEQLLAENLKVKAQLESEKKEREKLLKEIQKDKKRYASDIKKKQSEAKEIDRQIDKIVREAIAAANRKAAAKGTVSKAAVNTAAPNKITLTKEGKIVADSFRANKGKLPWPVEKGYMSMGYGLQRSVYASSVEVDHSWIEITTEKGADVRAVFGGEVMDIQVSKGVNTKTVLIQHGDYITIYMNLDTVNVQVGDKVGLKQSLGRVFTHPVTGKTTVKLMVMQNTTRLNPEEWIAR